MGELILFGPVGLPKLNNGQEVLFRILGEKFKNGGVVTKKEIIEIWKINVQRKAQSDHWEYDAELGFWVQGERDYTETQIEQLAVAWLLRALGALIKKGYLTVVPKIDLSAPQALQDNVSS